MCKTSFLFLNQEQVIAAGGIDMTQILPAVEKVLEMFHKGEYEAPHKVVLRYDSDASSEKTKGRINGMPAYIKGDVNVAGIKWIASSPDNPFKRNLPRASALTLLNDPETGLPIAFMDGTLISAMRTGAVTGIGAKYLARKNSETVGIIGAGIQARTQLTALLLTVPSIQYVKVYDLSYDRSSHFADMMNEELSVRVEAVETSEDAVRDSDIVVTVTTSLTPVFKGMWLKEGSLYVQCSGNECDTYTIKRASKVVFDSWVDVYHRGIATPTIMYNEGSFTEENIYGNIGAIICGEKIGRETNNENIVFCANGLAVEDMMVAKLVYDNARKKGLGQYLILWEKPHWI
jgi:ornithine cyclodeaminase